MDKRIVTISNISLQNRPAVTALTMYEKCYSNEHTRAAGWYYLKGLNFCSDYFESQANAWQWLAANAKNAVITAGHIDTPTGLLAQYFDWADPQ
ncbi:MAG: hypothetical protein KDK05_24835 [Candidatus Competibacteraceae bacterium]|nr:hypothetical protein [Candidatus Competibacteraceae bacterium]